MISASEARSIRLSAEADVDRAVEEALGAEISRQVRRVASGGGVWTRVALPSVIRCSDVPIQDFRDAVYRVLNKAGYRVLEMGSSYVEFTWRVDADPM